VIDSCHCLGLGHGHGSRGSRVTKCDPLSALVFGLICSWQISGAVVVTGLTRDRLDQQRTGSTVHSQSAMHCWQMFIIHIALLIAVCGKPRQIYCSASVKLLGGFDLTMLEALHPHVTVKLELWVEV